jgi:archaellum component FlaC
LHPADDDGIVVVMKKPDARDSASREKAALDAEIIQALDDLVADARHHGELIRASFARERRPTYEDRLGAVEQRLGSVEQRLGGVEHRLDGVEQRLDGIGRTLADMRVVLDTLATKSELGDMRQTMATLATKVEVDGLRDGIKMVADGYNTVSGRIDKVADLLKTRVVLP